MHLSQFTPLFLYARVQSPTLVSQFPPLVLQHFILVVEDAPPDDNATPIAPPMTQVLTPQCCAVLKEFISNIRGALHLQLVDSSNCRDA